MGARSSLGIQFHEMTQDEFAQQPGTWFHGTVNGMIDPGGTGFHVGTKYSAKIAMGVHLSRRVDNMDQHLDRRQEWREPHLLTTQRYVKEAKKTPGFIAPMGHIDPENDEPYNNNGASVYTSDPKVIPGRIVKPMANSTKTPGTDSNVNAKAAEGVQQQTGEGEFYRNMAEDRGSISAVLPGRSHFRTHEDYLVEARAKGKKIPKRAMRGYTEIPGQGRLF